MEKIKNIIKKLFENKIKIVTATYNVNIENIDINYTSYENIFIYIILISIILLIYNIIYYSKIINTVFSIAIIFFLSGLYFAYLNAEFLGLVIILIYVGAILVLFLFFIMIVDIKKTNINVNMYKNLITLYGLFIIFIFFLNNLYNNFDDIMNYSLLKSNIEVNMVHYDNNLESLGISLYYNYGFLIIEAGIILLVAMKGIILLNIKKVENKKTQNILRQILNIKK